MLAIQDLAASNARWIGAMRWRRHFELRHQGDLFASLSWESASGALVVARARNALWLFERAGLGHGRVAVRADARGPEIATFTPDWKNGGRLTVHGGGSFVWRTQGVSLSRWAFCGPDGVPRVELRVDAMRLAPSGTLAVMRDAGGEPALPLLATLGWYLTVQTLDDASLLVGASA